MPGIIPGVGIPVRRMNFSKASDRRGDEHSGEWRSEMDPTTLRALNRLERRLGRLPPLPPSPRNKNKNKENLEPTITTRIQNRQARTKSLGCFVAVPSNTSAFPLSKAVQQLLKLLQRSRRSLELKKRNQKETSDVVNSSGKRLTRSLSTRSDGHVCPVCLEGFWTKQPVMNLSCNHTFHTNCVLPWLASNSHCPCCRRQIMSLM